MVTASYSPGAVSPTTISMEGMELISALMSGDNATRRAAEQQYEAAKASSPGELLQLLLKISCNGETASAASPDQQAQLAGVQSMAAVLARRIIASEPLAAKAITTPEATFQVRSLALNALASTASDAVRGKLVHVISALASLVDDPSNTTTAPSGKPVCAPWPELVPGVATLAADVSADAKKRAAALLVIASVSEYATFLVRSSLQAVGQVLAAGLNDASSEDVRLAALKATSSLLLALEAAEERNAFKALVPSMLKVLHGALDGGNEAASCEALQALIEIAEEQPKLVRDHLEQVTTTMATVVSAASLEDETRQLAMEFLVRLAENAGGMVRKNKTFVETVLVPLSISLIAQGVDADFDLAAWNAAVNTVDEGQYADADRDSEHLAQVGEEAVDRIATALGGKAVFPAFKAHAMNMMQQTGDWTKQRAGLLALSLIGEGCGKAMFAQMQDVVAAVLPFVGAGHPRVRYAAITAIGQLAADFSDSDKCTGKKNFQALVGGAVLPKLAEAMEDESAPWRLRGHASSALINFSNAEACPVKLVRPHLHRLLLSMFTLVRDGPRRAKEEALTAVACLANVADAEFGQYYDHFMPIALQLIENATTKEFSALRGKAMECVGLMGLAVGKERFAPDAAKAMQLLMSVHQQSQADGDDEGTEEMYHVSRACARICGCLGKDFLPYMNVVLPPLLKAAAKKPGLTFEETEAENVGQASVDENGMQSFACRIRGAGALKININTHELQLMSTACHMLFEYADNLGTAFAPYVPQVAEVLLPLIEFPLLEAIRIAAICAVPKLLAAVAPDAKEGSPGHPMIAQTLLDAALPKLIDALATPDQEMATVVAEVMSETFRICHESNAAFGVFGEGIAKALESLVKSMKIKVEERIELRSTAAQDEDFDQEALELIEESEEMGNEFMTNLMDAIGYIIKSKKEAVVDAFEAIVHPFASALLRPEAPAALRATAICFYDDIVEHASPAAHKFIPMAVPFMIEWCDDEFDELAQAASYGLGVCAEFGGAAFASFCAQALPKLVNAIPGRALDDDGGSCAKDNAVSAAYKLCVHRSKECGVTLEQLLPTWLTWLPLCGDFLEARIMHGILIDLLVRRSPTLIGANGENIPAAVAIIASALEWGLEESGEYDEDEVTINAESRAKIGGALAALQQAHPAAIQAAVAALDVPHQQLLMRFASSQ